MTFWSTLASVGSNLLGSAIGSSNNSKTNQTNLAIARENNASQERMFNQQLEWNLAQWERNNEYNTPAAQMARYRAAGINPYLMMYGGAAGSGNASSPAAGSTPPQLHTPTMSSYDPSLAFGSIADKFFSSELQSSQVDNVRADTQQKTIDNMTRNAENIARIDGLAKKAKSDSARADLDSIEGMLRKATFSDSVNLARLQNKSLGEQIELTNRTRLGVELDNKLKKFNVKNVPAQFAANIAQIWSQVRLNNASTATQFAQQKKLAQDVLESAARAYGMKLDNGVKQALQQSMIEQGKAESLRTQEEADNVYYFGIPNPSYIVENHEGIGGKFGIGSSHTGYGNIRDAKGLAKKLHPKEKK